MLLEEASKCSQVGTLGLGGESAAGLALIVLSVSLPLGVTQ